MKELQKHSRAKRHAITAMQMRGMSPAHRRFDVTYDFSRNFAKSQMSFGRAALFVASYVG